MTSGSSVAKQKQERRGSHTHNRTDEEPPQGRRTRRSDRCQQQKRDPYWHQKDPDAEAGNEPDGKDDCADHPDDEPTGAP